MTKPTAYLVSSDFYNRLDEPVIIRAYDFNMGDERRSDLGNAIQLATQRAIDTDTDQQVRLSSGALFATQIWLIQAVDRNVKVPMGPDLLNLGHLRRMVHRARHLSDSTPTTVSFRDGQWVLVTHDVE